ncbi:MAG: S-layer homology domain-containing protein [Intestinimonas sp.]
MKRQIACLGLALSLWTGLASPALAAGFADVPEGHWARDSVAYVTGEGAVSGRGRGSFYPGCRHDPVHAGRGALPLRGVPCRHRLRDLFRRT